MVVFATLYSRARIKFPDKSVGFTATDTMVGAIYSDLVVTFSSFFNGCGLRKCAKLMKGLLMVGIFPAYDEDQNFIGWEVWHGDRKMHGPCSIEEAGAVVLQLQFLQQLGAEPYWEEGELLCTEVRDGENYLLRFDSIEEAANYFNYAEPRIDFESPANGTDATI